MNTVENWKGENVRGRELAAEMVEALQESDNAPAFVRDARRVLESESEGVRVGFLFAFAAKLRQ